MPVNLLIREHKLEESIAINFPNLVNAMDQTLTGAGADAFLVLAAIEVFGHKMNRHPLVGICFLAALAAGGRVDRNHSTSGNLGKVRI